MFQKNSVLQSCRALVVVGSLLLAACAPLAADDIAGSSVPQDVGAPAEVSAPEPAGAASADAASSEADAADTGNAADTADDNFEFTGVLTAVNGNVWTINGINVVLGGDFEIEGNPQVGSTVKVEGTLQPDGSLLAREIKTEFEADDDQADDDEAEFTGTVTAINGNVWTINGINVMVAGNVEVKGNPQVGSTVKVEGTLQPDGSLLAREIEGEDEADELGEAEFTGTVTAINGNVWTINGISVTVDLTTELDFVPQLGMPVKVEGVLQADGSFLATEIDPDNSGPGSFNSGPGGGLDDDADDVDEVDDDNSGPGGGLDDDADDTDDVDDDNNSGSGGGSDDAVDDDNSGSSDDDADDSDDDDSDEDD